MNTVSRRNLARRSSFAAATFIAGSAVLLTAACGNGRMVAGSESLASPSAAASPTPSAAVSATASDAATTRPSRPADGCPVGAATLLTTLRASDVYTRIEHTDSLVNVQCYAGYAIARTTVVHTDPATVLFRYDTATRAWTAVSAGTAHVCDGRVPATVRTHLTGC